MGIIKDEGGVIEPLSILTSGLTSKFYYFGLRVTTPIVVLGVMGLYQTIWNTMERHLRLEIWRPLLFTIKNLIFCCKNNKIRVSVDLVS